MLTRLGWSVRKGQLQELWERSEKGTCFIMMSVMPVSDQLMLTWKSRGGKTSVEAILLCDSTTKIFLSQLFGMRAIFI